MERRMEGTTLMAVRRMVYVNSFTSVVTLLVYQGIACISSQNLLTNPESHTLWKMVLGAQRSEGGISLIYNSLAETSDKPLYALAWEQDLNIDWDTETWYQQFSCSFKGIANVSLVSNLWPAGIWSPLVQRRSSQGLPPCVLGDVATGVIYYIYDGTVPVYVVSGIGFSLCYGGSRTWMSPKLRLLLLWTKKLKRYLWTLRNWFTSFYWGHKSP